MKWWQKKWVKSIFRIALALIILFCGIWLYIAQPSFSSNDPSERTADPASLRQHVDYLVTDCYPRTAVKGGKLAKAADYIEAQFRQFSQRVESQEYTIYDWEEHRNIIASFGPAEGKKLIIGAHYDAHDHTPGADDNASGVAGLLELARLLENESLDMQIQLIAYSSEEPPYFRSKDMGSRVHAASLEDQKDDITGVIVLEMIGYFDDSFGSQSYPLYTLHAFYPSRGNFITVVGNLSQRAFTKQVKVGMKGATEMPVYSINAPKAMPGIDFSDHASYWQHEMTAVMVTDTAFYRNPHYHEETDTLDQLDFERMAQVVTGVHAAALKIANGK
ncbi:M28 family peptidase [Persicirhabdus sediminis]|uniref:M28 family peptidase n=1 Tax=Persicirhabdus sediminis TaxID=454144 RepID=A0A8J7MFL2_9BACT|nr:M28 family peptidase [Persicirhabdus sediminis]MBK1792302.1 M28 family peptidase [Persicirhabdus sediminis]